MEENEGFFEGIGFTQFDILLCSFKSGTRLDISKPTIEHNKWVLQIDNSFHVPFFASFSVPLPP